MLERAVPSITAPSLPLLLVNTDLGFGGRRTSNNLDRRTLENHISDAEAPSAVELFEGADHSMTWPSVIERVLRFTRGCFLAASNEPGEEDGIQLEDGHDGWQVVSRRRSSKLALSQEAACQIQSELSVLTSSTPQEPNSKCWNSDFKQPSPLSTESCQYPTR